MVLPPQKNLYNRVPRADNLYLLRDTLHILYSLGETSSKSKLLNETVKTMQKPDRYFSDPSSFDDYLQVGEILDFIRIINESVILTERGKEFVKIDRFKLGLSPGEGKYLKKLLYQYPPFRTFIIKGFRQNSGVNNNQLSLYNKCPFRKDLLRSYMSEKGHNTDREARTLLAWSQQVGMVEFDNYSHRYHLIEERSDYDLSTFLKDLYKIYLEVRDSKAKVALIPEVRSPFCCFHSISRVAFDRMMLELNFLMPAIVQLGKASSSREIVRRFGIHGKPFYYYYVKIVEELM
jgi:hypothetical protein